ncbi:hypothetical protein M408DRAFT_26931 [Serendipita vermifera MAFF 305830]|uniref:Uncharacterized protein n=1 Tax=Serendipita vermifera MAFF 305830 TaxID=933852 RepID=A0A0C3AJ64_SERVB|nr:hypothetical protein M408DRAFT_26931 [Serendipita vermifera MAFF 305830]
MRKDEILMVPLPLNLPVSRRAPGFAASEHWRLESGLLNPFNNETTTMERQLRPSLEDPPTSAKAPATWPERRSGTA